MLRAASRPAARLVGRRGYAVAGRDGRPTRELSRIFEAASTGDHVDRARRPTGLFGRADLIEPAALTALAERTKADAAALVTGLLRGAVKTPAAVVDAFDELSNTICLTADLAEAVRNTHPDKAYVAAAEDAIRSLGNSINVLNTNVDLYNVLAAVVSSPAAAATLTPVQRRVAETFHHDFKRSGIDLPEAARNEVVQLTDEVLYQSMAFQEYTSTRKPVVKLPNGRKIAATAEAALYSDDAAVRRALYEGLYAEDAAGVEVMRRMLQSRLDLARRLNYRSYGELTLADKMAATPANVTAMLTDLAKHVQPLVADVRRRIVRDEDQPSGSRADATPLAPWDYPLYLARLTRNCFTSETIFSAPRFKVGPCMDGFNALIDRLFNVHFEPVVVAPGELWSTDVVPLDLVEETASGREVLGRIYCDFVARPGKLPGAAHFTVQCHRRMPQSGVQRPVVVLTCNWQAGNDGMYLSTDDVRTLFHELGHSLHSLLSTSEYQNVSGTRVQFDFAETPSTLMEFFAASPAIMQMLTPDPISRDYLASRDRSQALTLPFRVQTQIVQSLLDQYLHSEAPFSVSAGEYYDSLRERYMGIRPAPGTSWPLSFGHLSSYGAVYYTYVHCHVHPARPALAAQIWEHLFAADPFSRSAGERLRYDLLARGGTEDANVLMRRLLDGASISPEYLLHQLRSPSTIGFI